MVAKVGIPSFVVTLANVLLFQGILLLIVKDGGSVRIQNDFINRIVGGTLTPAQSWMVAIVGVGLYVLSEIRNQRVSYGAIPASLVAIRIGLAVVGAAIVTVLLNQDRAFAQPRCRSRACRS